MKTAERPSGETTGDLGRSVATTASRRQCAGGFRSTRAGRGIPPCSSLPIQTGNGFGMQTLDQNLTDLVKRNLISPAEARGKAKIPENFPG